MRAASVAVGLAVWLLLPSSGQAQAANDTALQEFAFHPHPGARLPLGIVLSDERGRAVSLGQFFTGKPVVLVLDYLRCKTLCGLTLGNVIATLDTLPLQAGREFRMLAISIDPRDTPTELLAAKTKYLAGYHHQDGADGIFFLAGTPEALRSIADAVGFPYRYDRELDQYIHPAGFVVAAGNGTISRYLLGVGAGSAELGEALADTAQGRSLGVLTQIALLCHVEGLPLGRWTVPILAVFTIANLGAMAGLVAVFAAIRRRRAG